MVNNLTEYEEKFKIYTGTNFNECYNKYKPKLVWHLVRYTQDRDLAEDFAHDALIQSLEKIELYDKNKSQYITWLTKIAIHIVIRYHNERKRLDPVSMDKPLSNESNLSDYIKYDDDMEDVEHFNTILKKAGIVKDAIYKLPEKYKRVMVMRELDEMSYKEIANSIIKEDSYDLLNEKLNFPRSEDFLEMDVSNTGDGDIIIKINDGRVDEIIRCVKPGHRLILTRYDIHWIRSMYDVYEIDCLNSKCHIEYKTTTNLSTIKSQIKKGRSLIQKKVKKTFDTINIQGV